MLKSSIFYEDDTAVMLSPDSFESGLKTYERERGGIALSDPSQGINVHDWYCQYVAATGSIYLTNMNTATTYLILSGISNVVALSFAFDSNMRPNLGYMTSDGVSKIRYYDTVTEQFVTETLPTGAGAPRLCHDDKRNEMVQINVTDVLVFYILGTTLYYLVQRERFQTAHQAATLTEGSILDKVGMSDDLRILAQISNGTFVSSP